MQKNNLIELYKLAKDKKYFLERYQRHNAESMILNFLSYDYLMKASVTYNFLKDSWKITDGCFKDDLDIILDEDGIISDLFKGD